MMNEVELLKLKGKIDEAKSKASELQGQKDYLLKELKTNWKCTDVEEAETKLEEINETISDLDEQIKDGLVKLEKQINAS
jgi:predicted nuclease with TOPRIM domain